MLVFLLLIISLVVYGECFRSPWRVDLDVDSSWSNEILDATRQFNYPAAEENPQILSHELDAFIVDIMERWDVQGLQVAVVHRRSNSSHFHVETKAYGSRGSDQAPMMTNTLFPIASNSKAFTAASVGLLVANDSIPLEWSTKLHQIFPEFKLQDPIAAKLVNVVDMLGHRTGLPRHDFAVTKDTDSSLKHVKYFRPSAELRDIWQYSNHMYNIAASLVTRLSRISFFDFLKTNLFEPIGFTETEIHSKALVDSGRVAAGAFKIGESVNNRGKVYWTWPWDDLALYGPGDGCILSTADDVAVWLQTLLNNGKSPKTGLQVVPDHILDRMSSGISVTAPNIRRPAELGPSVYGMAFSSSSYQGHQFIEHGGALVGYYSQISRFPNDGLGIAVLVSGDSSEPQEIVKWRIAEQVLQLPVRVDWNARFLLAKKVVLQAAADEEAARLPSPPNAPPPDTPLSHLASTYRHGAYGHLSFQISKKNQNEELVSKTEDWMGYPSTLNLRHYAANVFNASIVLSIPVIDQSEHVEYEMKGFQVEFEVVHGVVRGFGIWGGLWGAGVGVESPKGDSARARAEVWFEHEVSANNKWEDVYQSQHVLM